MSRYGPSVLPVYPGRTRTTGERIAGVAERASDTVRTISGRREQEKRAPAAAPRRRTVFDFPGWGSPKSRRLGRRVSDRFPELRARLTVADVVQALELKPRSDGFACPRCGARFQLYDDATFGVAVRCLAPCKLSEWGWPEHVLADVRGIDFAEAERRLLPAIRRSGPVVVRQSGDRPATSLALRLDGVLGAA